MNAIRKIYNCLPATIRTPKELKHHHVEVILLPLGNHDGKSAGLSQSASSLHQLAGSLVGEPLKRESHGDYETRLEFK